MEKKGVPGAQDILRRGSTSDPRDMMTFLEDAAVVANEICQAQQQPVERDMKKHTSYLTSIHSEASAVMTTAGLCAPTPGVAEAGDVIAVVDGAYAAMLLRPS